MKLAALALLCLAWPAQAQRSQEFSTDFYQFCGLDQFHDATQLDPCSATDAQNVLTDGGYLEKRTGNSRLVTVSSGSAVRFVNEWIDSSNTRYIIAHSSNAIYQTIFSSAVPVQISTMNPGYEIGMAAAFNNVYFTNNFDPNFYWTGTASFTIPGMSNCAYPLFADERLYCANTSVSGSQVEISSFGGAGYWTVPTILTADNPNNFTFQKNDGESITCFAKTPWGKFVGKPHSIHLLKGYDNNTYYKRVIDPAIGCIDNRGVQMLDGLLIWPAYDGIYVWDGADRPQLISLDITPLYLKARQLASNANFWLLTSQSDFQQGDGTQSGSGAVISATLVPGDLVPSSATFVLPTQSDWQLFTSSVNISTIIVPGAVTLAVSTIGAGGDTLDPGYWTYGLLYSTGANALTCHAHLTPMAQGNIPLDAGAGAATCADTSYGIRVTSISILNAFTNAVLVSTSYAQPFPEVCVNTSLFLSTSNYIPDSTPVKIRFRFGFCASPGNPSCSPVTNYDFVSSSAIPGPNFSFAQQYYRDGTNNCNWRFEVNKSTEFFVSGKITHQAYNTALSTPVYGNFNTTASSAPDTGFFYQTKTSADNITYGALVTQSTGTQIAAASKQYLVAISSLTTNISTKTPVEYSISINADTTGYYYAPVKFIGGAITKFLAFDSNDSVTGSSTVTYWSRSQSTAFGKLDATPAWTAQNNHTLITVSTSATTYYQWRALLGPVNGDDQMAIHDVKVNWQEGTSVPMASIVFDHRYLLAVTLSTANTSNDTVFVWQKNRKWTKFAGPSYYSMGIWNNNPIAGSSGNDSSVWKILQASVYNDDGSAISAYWIGKELALPEPMSNKVINDLWLDATIDPNQNNYANSYQIDASYAVNRSSQTFTKKTVFFNAGQPFALQRVPISAGYIQGKSLRFKFSNNIVEQYFRLNGYSVYGQIQPRTQN